MTTPPLIHIDKNALRAALLAHPDGSLLKSLVEELLDDTVVGSGRGRSGLGTDSQHNVGDGGVDSEVVAIPEETKNDWFKIPTIWQFKQSEAPTSAAVQNELLGTRKAKAGAKKKSAKAVASDAGTTERRILRRLRSGYGYRWVVGQSRPSLPDDETTASDEVRKVVPDWTGTFHVVDLGRLARWLDDHPFVLLKHDLVSLGGAREPSGILREERHLFPNYAFLESWNGQASSLREWLAGPTDTPKIFVVGGRPGVGKTRFVVEALDSAGMSWVYCLGSSAVQSACAALYKGTGVIVADDVPWGDQPKLSSWLGPTVRAILISNDDELTEGPIPRGAVVLPPPTGQDLEAVLARNESLRVPGVSAADLHRFTGGFLRLVRFMADDPTGSGPRHLWAHLKERLGANVADTLGLLALAQRVGWTGARKDELKELCAAVGFAGETHEPHIAVLKRHGFLQSDSLYLYVTPQRVVEAAVDHGWRKYGGQRLLDILATPDAVSENVASAIHGRLKHAPDPIRGAYGVFFFRLISGRGLRETMGTAARLRGFLSLLEADPARYLPLLEGWLAEAPPDDFIALARRIAGPGWSPYRQLVFSVTKLGTFADWFLGAEAALWHLALNEQEPKLGNNASEIWKSWFAPALPGSAAPFGQRLALLGKRARSSVAGARTLALAALAEEPERHVSQARVQGPVGGRPVPPDDNPTDRAEFTDRCKQMYAGLVTLAEDQDYPGVGEAEAHVERRFSRIASSLGLSRVLKVLDSSPRVDAAATAKCLDYFIDFVSRSAAHHAERLASDVAMAQAWLAAYWARGDFGDLKRMVSGRRQMLGPEDQATWRADFVKCLSELPDVQRIAALAAIEADESLVPEGETWHLVEVGRVLGLAHGAAPPAEDPTIGWILGGDVAHDRHARLRYGWLLGHLAARQEESLAQFVQDRVLRLVDADLPDSPDSTQAPNDVTLTLLVDFGPELNGFARVLDLIRARRLSWKLLLSVQFRRTFRLANTDQRAETVRLVANRVADAPPEAAASLDLLAHICPSADEEDRPLWWASFPARGEGIQILRTAVGTRLAQMEQYHLKRVLEALPVADVKPVVLLALDLGEVDRELVDDLLQDLCIPQDAAGVMDELGKRVVDRTTGYLQSFPKCFASMPAETLLAWTERAGPDAAVALATELPRPDDWEPEAALPPVTAQFMLRFGEHHKVLRRFSSWHPMDVRRVLPVTDQRQLVERWRTRAGNASPAWEKRWANSVADRLARAAEHWADEEAEDWGLDRQ